MNSCGAGCHPAADCQSANSRFLGNSRFQTLPKGRLPIGRRLATCPTYYVAILALLAAIVLPAQTLEQFKPVRKKHFLFGRGACDMKGGIVAMLYGMRALMEFGVKLDGKIGLMLVPGKFAQRSAEFV